MNDMRKRESRDSEVYDQIVQFGGVSVAWLAENRLRGTALNRLMASRRVKLVAGGTKAYLALEPVIERQPWWQRFVEWLIGRPE